MILRPFPPHLFFVDASTRILSADVHDRFEQVYRNSGNPLLLSVGGTKIPPDTSGDEVRSLLQSERPGEDGKIALRLVGVLHTIFASPPLAVLRGLADVLKYMVEEGIIEINDRFLLHSGLSPVPLLFHAISADNGFDSFEYLISFENINVNAGNTGDGMKLIHCCVAKDRVPVKILKVLLRHPNVEVNALTPWGSTALFFACTKADVAKVSELLQGGADPDVDLGGFTVVDFMQQKDWSDKERNRVDEIIELLEHASAATTVL